MTTRRTPALVAVLSFVAAAALGGCGSSGEDKPTTQAVDEYARTEAAKRSSSSRQAEPAGTPAQPGTSAATSESAEHSDRSSASSSPEPGQITDRAAVSKGKRAVSRYISALNSAGRDPKSRSSLDAYTTSECESCASLKRMLARFDKRNQRFAGDLVAFKTSEVRTSDSANTLRVFGTLKQLPTPIVGDDGKEVSRNKAKDLPRAFYVTTSEPTGRISKIKGVVG